MGDLAHRGNERRVGEAGIVADDHRRHVIQILQRLEVQDGIGRVADENDRVGRELLELQHLAGDVRAVGVVGDLRRHLDAAPVRRVGDAGRDRGAVVGVLVDDGDGIDLPAGLLQLAQK